MLRLAFVVFFCLVLQRNAQRIYYSKIRFHVLGEVMIFFFFFISHSVYINQDSVMISDNVRAILPKLLT